METAFCLRAAAEEWAGSAFSEKEYQLALSAARRKLEYINNWNGTHHGEPYLAILIAEDVGAQRITRCLKATWDLWKMAREP